jgi:hypothetical protein
MDIKVGDTVEWQTSHLDGRVTKTHAGVVEYINDENEVSVKPWDSHLCVDVNISHITKINEEEV